MIELADELFNKFSPKNKKLCIFHIIKLFRLINAGHGLSNHVTFIIDTNILIYLEAPERSTSKVFYCAIIFTFRAIYNLNVKYEILITPAVFWEFCENGKSEQIEYQHQLNKKISELVKMLSVLRLPVSISPIIYNFMHYNETKYKIKSDIYLMRKYLEKFKTLNLEEGINNSRGIPLIYSSVVNYIQDNLDPDDLKYFDEKHVTLFLASHLNEMVLDVVDDQKIKQTNRDTTGTIKLRKKIIEFNNREIKGIGDIELLSFCDIGVQFHYSTRKTYVGLTFENKLIKLLLDHSEPVIGTRKIHMGRDDTELIMNIEWNKLLTKRKKSDNQCFMQHKLINDFYDEIEKIPCIEAFFDYENSLLN